MKLAKLLTINLIIFFLTFELFSFIFLKITNNDKKFEEIYLGLKKNSYKEENFLNKAAYTNYIYPHPYLAYSHNPYNSKLKMNNIHFRSLNDVQFNKSEKVFYIGIFGGSVAASFANNLEVNSKVEKCYTYDNKTIKFVNFADNAYKQPQTNISLILHKNFINMAISIEGFNESYMVDEKNYFFDLPASNFNWVHPQLSEISLFHIIYLKLFKIKNNQLSSTNTTKLFTLFARKLFEKSRYTSKDSRYKSSKDIKKQINIRDYNLFKYYNYMKDFLLLSNTLDGKGYIFLQPFPIYKNLSLKEKNFLTEREKQRQEKFINRLNNYSKEIDKPYKDLSSIYKFNSDDIFIDIIHLNNRGNLILLKKIFSEINSDYINYSC